MKNPISPPITSASCKTSENIAQAQKKACVTIVLSDTDNDLKSVQYTLWIAGICNKTGIWYKDTQHICIIHTGDWINKWNPAPTIVDYFQILQESAPKKCGVYLLQGNHELELLKRIRQGEEKRLTLRQSNFIQRQDILRVDDGVLYIHGYPSFGLLGLLKQIQESNKNLNDFNDLFRKAFYEGQYALYLNETGLELVGDIRKASRYYLHYCQDGETRGRKISKLLTSLGLTTIIHGHKPHMLTQIDDEMRVEIPGIRVINNDNQAKISGLGASILDKKKQIIFVNLKEMYLAGGEKAFQKIICQKIDKMKNALL
ncbi:MAG: metallophosphoesterase [Magnetococcus sp. DMHC-6]